MRSVESHTGERYDPELASGGILGLVGGLGYFVTLLFHGDLPDHTTATALEHFAGRPEWSLLKWVLIA